MKKQLNCFLALIMIVFSSSVEKTSAPISIIPMPESMQLTEGYFKINSHTRLAVN